MLVLLSKTTIAVTVIVHFYVQHVDCDMHILI